MKKKLPFIIIALGMAALLFIVAKLRLADKKSADFTQSKLTYKELFVEVKADTLEYYINRCLTKENHPSLKISNKSKQLVIEYNRDSPILLNIIDNGMNEEREELKKSGIIVDDAQKTKIILNKHKINGIQYVNCPSPIISEILRIITSQELANSSK